MRVDIKLNGDKALLKRLGNLEPSVRKKVLRPAVTAAARPIRMAARGNAPVRFGALAKAIDLKTKTYRQTAVCIVGPRSDISYVGTTIFGTAINAKPSKYAHLAEQGAKAHPIRMGKGHTVVWIHPGAKASHFMERAYTAQAANAMQILNSKIAEGLEKVA